MRRLLVVGVVLFAAVAAEAKPYRAMVTRTARRVPNGMLELGGRWWILPRLEAEVQIEALLVGHPFYQWRGLLGLTYEFNL